MSVSVYNYGLNLSKQKEDAINKFEEFFNNFKNNRKESKHHNKRFALYYKFSCIRRFTSTFKIT